MPLPSILDYVRIGLIPVVTWLFCAFPLPIWTFTVPAVYAASVLLVYANRVR